MAENQNMDVLERWAHEVSAQLAPSLDGIDRLKITLGLIQARAQECRHQAGKFAMAAPGTLYQSQGVARHFIDRADMMEAYGNKLAEKWMEEHAKPMVELQ